MKKKQILSKYLQINNNSVRGIFFVGLILSIFIVGGRLIVSGGEFFYTSLYGYNVNGNSSYFWDFFGNLYFNTKKGFLAWELNSDYPYPALANVLYYIIGQLTVHVPIEQLQNSVVGIMTYTLYLIIEVILFDYAVGLFVRNGKWRKNLLVKVGIIFSFPFFFGAIITGNLILLTVIFLMIAAGWMSSQSRIKREGALLLIAAAASFKVFPAIFGLIYLKEKRWKEAFRLLIYGCIFFFVPFIWFGGVDGIRMFIENSFGHEQMMNSYGTLDYYLVANEVYGAKNIAIIILAVIIIIAVFFLTNDKVVQMILLSGLLMMVFGTCQPYYRVYIAIPLLLWLEESERQRPVWMDMVFAFSFLDVLWRGIHLKESSIVIWLLLFICIFYSLYPWILSGISRVFE